jgi:signal transduction histidine kinase/FixJ family two-component response regulator
MPPQRTDTDGGVRRLFRAAAILLPALGLVALTWVGTLAAIRAQRDDATARIVARVTNQANSFQAQISQQILTLDQTLRFLAGAWDVDPQKFDLLAWRDRTVALSGISRDLLLVDQNGRVVQSTAPDAVGTDVSGRGYFVFAQQQGKVRKNEHLDLQSSSDDTVSVPDSADGTYVGPATMDPARRQWHVSMARSLLYRDGSFGGAVVVEWRTNAIDTIFRAADLGEDPLMALVGLSDGKLRAIVGPATGGPGDSIADSQMFAMLQGSPDGVWIGRSSLRGVVRVHAFRRIPARDLAVVVGVDLDEALTPIRAWALEAKLFAGGITVLIAIIAAMLWISLTQAHRRRATLAFNRAMLTSTSSQLEIAKTHADARNAQLEATLDGMSDGVAMVDAQLCLSQWNRHFPEIAGVPREILRIGLPVEDILRAQAKSGQFGPVNVEDEVARRIALLRSGSRTGTFERKRPDGRTIELRRYRLPDGGFVVLYVDVTTRNHAEDALREAGAVAEAVTEAKSRFVAIVSHEIRAPLNALLATLTLLHDIGLPPAQRALLDMSRQSGDALLGLINDILEMSRVESGQLSLRPSLFGLRELLDSVIEMFRAQAVERGIVLGLAVLPGLPREHYADPGRVRQVLINLLSNAVKFGQPGAVGLLAGQETDANGRPVLYFAVRDGGPVIEPAGRERLFRPFSHPDSGEPGADGSIASGLGLAICRQLVALMGGEIGCDPWMTEDGHAGNEFWVRLPITPPLDDTQAPRVDQPLRRILPRSRILLVDDILANQLVTATLLRREGHLVDIATDGREALQAVARRPYDLVFMDIFMPGMSGFDVARQIRAMPAPACSIPIVALTANVSLDDQALCREAGMNRLLTKPVSLPDLVRALAELPWRGLPERNAALPVAAVPRRDSVLSAERIGELRNSLPADMLGGMVEECLIDLHARLPALRRAMEAGDGNDVAAQAHAMVGMAAGYGMAALEARLRALMQAARGSDIGRVAALAVELDAELSMAANALRDALAIEIV